jgi:parallel beta-helix repeat protein
LFTLRTTPLVPAAGALLILTAPAFAACVVPTDGMTITQDTTLCAGDYHVPNGITIAADNVTVTGENPGVTLRGNITGYGLQASNRHHLTITNITTRRFFHAFHFAGCDHLTITQCNAWQTPELPEGEIFLDIFQGPWGDYAHAMWLNDCDDAAVTYNNVDDQQNGISLFNCQRPIVTHNYASYNTGWGIQLYNVDDALVQYNIADYCTRDYQGWSGADAASLLIVYDSNGNQVLDNSLVGGGDGVFLAGMTHWHGRYPCNNNYFARNDCSLSPNNGFEGTFSENNVFEDNLTDGCNYGYWLGYARNNTIRNNRMADCITSGISIEHGHGHLIEQNTIRNCGIAIQLWTDEDSSLVNTWPENRDSYGYTIRENVVTYNTYAISCTGGGPDRLSYDYTINNNTLAHNAYGIIFAESNASTIYSNWLRHNSNGIRFFNSNNNTVYDNFLFLNGNPAIDNGTNTWSITPIAGTSIVGGNWLAGNYWSDYAGVDTDGDGLGDTLVPHTAAGQIATGGDLAPLIWDDPDCNGNGLPDASEPDCDNNGRPDECDIADGLHPDCNSNNVPDSCDIAGGTSTDCNNDGIPDDCSTDCNANGVPDVCDLLDGTLTDANNDGVPDECTDRPRVLAVWPTSARALKVQFSKPVDAQSAGNPASYALDPPVAVLSVALDASQEIATVTTAALSYNATYWLTVTGVQDLQSPANTIAPDTETVFSNGRSRPATTGLCGLWDCDNIAGDMLADTSGYGTPLDLNIVDPAAVRPIPGGIELIGDAVITSGESTDKLARAVSLTQAFSLEAWAAPARTFQPGPAFIAAYATSPFACNFRLTQGTDDGLTDVFDAALRTTTSNVNGAPTLTSPAQRVSTALTHIVFSRDAAGLARLYLDGEIVAQGDRLGDFNNWNPDYRFVVGNDHWGTSPWHGVLHHLAVYNSPLAPGLVTDLYLAGPQPIGGFFPADVDLDGDIDMLDADGLLNCLAGPDVPECPPTGDPIVFNRADFAADNDVDLPDAARLQREYALDK